MASTEMPDAEASVPAASGDPVPTFETREPQTITIPVVLPLNQHARVWMLLSGVLGIMLIAALVIVGYLWNVNGKWQSQVSSLTSTGYDLGDRIADHQKQIDQLNATNALLSDQLGTAKDKVLALSNEKAQWSDQTAYAQQQVDLLDAQIESAQTVITQLGRCVEGEQQLAVYVASLSVPGDTGGAGGTGGDGGATAGGTDGTDPTYTAAQVAEFRTSVETLCGAATKATTAFQKSITQ